MINDVLHEYNDLIPTDQQFEIIIFGPCVADPPCRSNGFHWCSHPNSLFQDVENPVSTEGKIEHTQKEKQKDHDMCLISSEWAGPSAPTSQH